MEGILDILISASSGKFNWYGFLIGGGMVLCVTIAYFIAKKRGIYADIVIDIALVCIPLAIVGARIYFIVFNVIGGDGEWSDWPLKRVIGLDGGLAGLAIYGGLIGAVIGGIIMHFWKRNKPDNKGANFWQLADLAFVLIILGQAIGRWGNFANHEAYGNQITNPAWQWFPIAVKINSYYYQATFFYESFWNIIGFGLLLWLYMGKRKSFDGFILSVYCIYYGIGRLWIEGLRSDSLLTASGLRVSQLVSGIIIVFGIAMIITHLYKARMAGKKPFIFVDTALLNNDYYGYEKTRLANPYIYQPKKSVADETADYSDDFYKTADEGFESNKEEASSILDKASIDLSEILSSDLLTENDDKSKD